MTTGLERWRTRLGRVGIWTYQLNYFPTPRVREVVAELEELGYGAIWTGEAVYREPLTAAGVLLAATSEMTVATGIASIWNRDAFTMTAAQLTLAEAYPERFLLGIGVSHQRLTEGLRGHDYSKPLAAMRGYLDRMDAAEQAYRAVRPDHRPPRLLAALGPEMTALARDRADGAHTYLVTPEHTGKARGILGPDKLLAVEQAVVLTDDSDEGRRIGRRHVSRYLDLDNYVSNWRRLGFDETDFADGGSDRLVDTLVVHGDLDVIARCIRQHLEAGADHVCIQTFVDDPHGLPAESWRLISDLLADV